MAGGLNLTGWAPKETVAPALPGLHATTAATPSAPTASVKGVGGLKPLPGRPTMGSGQYGPLVPNAPTLPAMPFNFAMNGNVGGTGGAGGGGGAGGSGGTGGGTSGPPGAANPTTFTGSKSSELSDTFGKANSLFDSAPSMMDKAILDARDASTMQAREIADKGMLAGGRTSPGMTRDLAAQTTRNIADAAKKAQVDTYQMKLGALNPALQAGGAIAGDLRAQQNAATQAYGAATNAWQVANQSDIARQRMNLDAQIAGMNAQLGMYNSLFGLYGSMMNGMSGWM